MNKKNRESILKKNNVWAVGEGYKKSRNPLKQLKNIIKKARGEKAVRVYVTKKKKLSELSKKDLIPKQIEGKETDVVEATPIEHLSEYRAKHRPVKTGVSMCNAYGTACTSGGPVYKDGKTFALVNNHCQDRFGISSLITYKGDPIIQPSLFDGGSLEENQVGEVYEWYERDPNKINEMDAGLNLMHEEMIPTTLGGNYNKKVVETEPGKTVQKYGRTTGHTTAKVLDTNVYVKVNSEAGVVTYEGAVFTEAKLGAGGDSSSWIFNKDMNIVGQLFAGSDEIMCFQPMQKVLDYFNVSLVPEEETYFVAAGRDWYIDIPLGKTKTTVNLNLRTEPRVASNTYVKTLPKGTEIDIIKKLGKSGGYEWLQIST